VVDPTPKLEGGGALLPPGARLEVIYLYLYLSIYLSIYIYIYIYIYADDVFRVADPTPKLDDGGARLPPGARLEVYPHISVSVSVSLSMYIHVYAHIYIDNVFRVADPTPKLDDGGALLPPGARLEVI